MAYMKDSTGRRLDDFPVVGTADNAVITGQFSHRQFPKVQASDGSKITAKALGEGSAGLVDAVHDDNFGYLYHLQAGVNSTGSAALVGMGLDKGGAHGLLISAKSTGRGIDAANNPSSTGDLARLRNWSTAMALDVAVQVGAGPMRIRQANAQGFGDGAATLGSTTFTSATANFTGGDVGSVISQLTSRGEGFVFAANTTIASVTNSTTVVLDKAAVKTGSGVNFQIANRAAVDTQTVLEFRNATDGQRLDLTAARLKLLGGTVVHVENAGSNARLTTIENARIGLYTTNGTNWKRNEFYGGNYFWGSLRAWAAAGTIGGESTSVDAIKFSTSGVGFNGTDPIAKPAISGSRGGNAALASLITALATYGLVTDSSTA